MGRHTSGSRLHQNREQSDATLTPSETENLGNTNTPGEKSQDEERNLSPQKSRKSRKAGRLQGKQSRSERTNNEGSCTEGLDDDRSSHKDVQGEEDSEQLNQATPATLASSGTHHPPATSKAVSPPSTASVQALAPSPSTVLPSSAQVATSGAESHEEVAPLSRPIVLKHLAALDIEGVDNEPHVRSYESQILKAKREYIANGEEAHFAAAVTRVAQYSAEARAPEAFGKEQTVLRVYSRNIPWLKHTTMTGNWKSVPPYLVRKNKDGDQVPVKAEQFKKRKNEKGAWAIIDNSLQHVEEELGHLKGVQSTGLCASRRIAK